MNIHGIKFTTADLARELGISKRAVYEHFNSKENLMGAVFDSVLADFRQQISCIVHDESLNIVDKLTALMVFSPKALGPINVQVINDVKRFLPKEWAKFENYFTERWGLVEQVIKQGQTNGVLTQVDLAILQKMYMGTIDNLLDHHFLTRNNMTFKNAMTKAAEILIYGLVSPHYREK